MNRRVPPWARLARGLALAALAASGWWITAAARPQGLEGVLVWPLGPDGSIARVLYSTHGQYFDIGYGPLAHQGIDIGATPNEAVYAVEDGTVVLSTVGKEGSDPLYQELIVSRGDELSEGIRYLHLGSAEVQVGDKVVRDQFLGTIVDWEDTASEEVSCCFDHLHLQVVSRSSLGGGSDEAWTASSAGDAGNPLALFEAGSDSEPPWINELPSDYATSATVLFFKDGSDVELKPGHLEGKVDIVASFHDRVTGVAPPAPTAAGSCDCTPAEQVVPCRIEVHIVPVDAAGTELPGTAEEVIGPIELLDSIRSSTQDLLAKGIYHSKSVGTYAKRDLRFVLTHDVATYSGAWSPPAVGNYRIEITVTDAAGNVLDVPPVDVTVASL